MSRIRSLKPEFTQNERLSALPAETHLLAAGLLCYADDEGYFYAHPKLIQSAIFPLRELSVSVPAMLQSLLGIGYVELFIGSNGKEYGRIVNFLEHQRVSHPMRSKIKTFSESSRVAPESSVKAPERLRPEVELKGNGIELEVEGEAHPNFSTLTEVPEQQHPLSHARRMVEILGMPNTSANLRSVEAGLTAEANHSGSPLEEVAQMVADKAIVDRRRGVAIDKFYFEDTKWRNGNGQSKPSASAARSERSKTNILDGIAKDIGRRDALVGPELKIGTGK